MKVYINYLNKTEIVENVSVDDKCLPIVAGLHPYSPSSRDTSPLVCESALWFKTLAVDAVYIDCDRRLIHWTPVINNNNNPNVVLRRSGLPDTEPAQFTPSCAVPLINDSAVYDFDASLKDMMGKCSDAMRKLFKKSLSVDEFHKIVAKMLHLYILPSITFSPDNVYCLTRAQALIELRLSKSEDEIATKASSIENLVNCMNTLKTNLLQRDDFESERYLRTCKKDFLIVFLKVIEADVDALNFQLSAEQSKVNWAKEHPEESHNLAELQESRNSAFQNVGTFIRVREAIKNVISRRDLTKRKLKKQQVINSCFHNVFVEIVRRLELDELCLRNLGNDKVNICAAREAVVCTILELVSENRGSDRATKFDPEDFADFSVNESHQGQKCGVWLTFQERVERLLDNHSSAAYRCHRDGCRTIVSKINLAISEFQLAGRRALSSAKRDNISSHLFVSVDDVVLRNSRIVDESLAHRNVVVVNGEHDQATECHKCTTLGAAACNHEDNRKSHFLERKVLSASEINFDLSTSEDNSCSHDSKHRRSVSQHSVDELLSSSANEEESEVAGYVLMQGSQLRRQRNIMTRQLALSSLLNAVDNLKGQIQGHFREVISSLDLEFSIENVDESSNHEQQELLWKAYEQLFCEKVYPTLLQLYTTGFMPGTQKAYTTIKQTPLQEILVEDKLLDLFFGDSETMNSRGVSIPLHPGDVSPDKFSMAKTLSDLSLDVRRYDIKDLYTLANADSDDLCRRFNLEDAQDDEDNTKTSSSNSLNSLSEDEGAYDGTSNSPTDSGQSALSCGNLEVEGMSNKWSVLSCSEKVEEILDPVLTPFRKLVRKCLDATCFLDKVRYITKAIEGLNKDISGMIGPEFQSACDDIISMIILALCNMSEDVFVGLYVNLRLLMDVLPAFLSGTLWDYNLVSLHAAYDFLFTLKVCENVVKQYPGSFRIRR